MSGYIAYVRLHSLFTFTFTGLNTIAESKKPHGPDMTYHAPNVNHCTPKATTNAGQWNIVRTGYARVGFTLAM